MDATPDPASQQTPAQTHEERSVTVRRSPKYGVFMAIGALLGMVVAWLVSTNVPPSFNETGQQVDTTPVVGLMLVVGFVVGGVVGAIVAIVIDRMLSKGTRTVVAERIETHEADPVDEPAADAGERMEAAPEQPAAEGTAPEDDRPREA